MIKLLFFSTKVFQATITTFRKDGVQLRGKLLKKGQILLKQRRSQQGKSLLESKVPQEKRKILFVQRGSVQMNSSSLVKDVHVVKPSLAEMMSFLKDASWL